MKYDITYSCGHKGVVDLIGKSEERERKIYGYEHYGLCPECQAKKKAQENELNIKKAEEMGLPKLEGSEKQIAWAEKIRLNFLLNEKRVFAMPVIDAWKNNRDKLIENIELAEKTGYENLNEGWKMILRCYRVMTSTSAKWLIENRFDL